MSKSIMIPVSNLRVAEEWIFHPGFRTQAQFEKVKGIVNTPEFDFSCNHAMFDGDNSKYSGPVNFTYYTVDGRLHTVRIGAKGKILNYACGN